jgi:hypothetical protein
MWNFLKFNLFSMVISLIVTIGGAYIAYLGQSIEIVMGIFMTIATLSLGAFFFSIVGTIADCWRVFVKGEEVEGFKWEPAPKSVSVSTQPGQTKQTERTWQDLAKENMAKKLSTQINEPQPESRKQSAPNDPLGIR